MSETNLVPWPLRIVKIGSEGIAIKPDSGDLRTDMTTLAMCGIDERLAILFAAAPDLLVALKSTLLSFFESEEGTCLECGESLGAGAGCESCHVWEKAQAAIAKAGTQ